jgi:aryl-alcohol dehydrogenase-like predicted oxidoreductase
MQQRYLGATGLKVSELCLGAMTFGREADEATSRQMMDRFAEAGGTFIDTANVYSTGGSEEVVGRWLADHDREAFVVATKVRWPMGSGGNDRGLSRRHILAAVDASLRRLGTDYIDLYQVHAWDPGAPLEETLGTLDSLVTSGKVRYLGVSNFTGWQLQKAIDLSRQHGWEPFVCLQPLYNLLDRETELELLPVCREEGLGVIPWSPLRGGWLTGRYQRGMGGAPEGTRVGDAEKNNWAETWAAYDNERTWSVLDTLAQVADEFGRTQAQVALRWLLQQDGVTAPIIGARTMEQFEANLGAVGWNLDDKSVARLTEASDRPLPYPYYITRGADRL